MWEATDRTPPSWTFEETIAVYAADVPTPVGNARVFVNEEAVTILPSNVNLPMGFRLRVALCGHRRGG